MEPKKRQGRPKGYPKTGGRKKGSKNKATIAAEGMTPDILRTYITRVYDLDLERLTPHQRINAMLRLVRLLDDE